MTDEVPISFVNTPHLPKSVLGPGATLAQAVASFATPIIKERVDVPAPPGEMHSIKLEAAILKCLICPEIEVYTDKTLHPWEVVIGIETEANMQKFRAGEVAAVVLRLLGRAMDSAYTYEQNVEARERAAKQAFSRPTRKMSI